MLDGKPKMATSFWTFERRVKPYMAGHQTQFDDFPLKSLSI
jgi:hypothetical protein